MGCQLRDTGFSIEAQSNPLLPLALLDTDGGLIIEGSSRGGSNSSRRLATIRIGIEVQVDTIAGEVPTAGVTKLGSGTDMGRSGLKHRERGVDGNRAPLIVALVKTVHLAVEAEKVLLA
jgi:hypothetical protein